MCGQLRNVFSRADAHHCGHYKNAFSAADTGTDAVSHPSTHTSADTIALVGSHSDADHLATHDWSSHLDSHAHASADVGDVDTIVLACFYRSQHIFDRIDGCGTSTTPRKTY